MKKEKYGELWQMDDCGKQEQWALGALETQHVLGRHKCSLDLLWAESDLLYSVYASVSSCDEICEKYLKLFSVRVLSSFSRWARDQRSVGYICRSIRWELGLRDLSESV